MSDMEWTEINQDMAAERELPFCPLLAYTCRADCAWFHKTLHKCAVVITAAKNDGRG